MASSRKSISLTSAPASRAPVAAMRTSFLLSEPLRRLPANARIFSAITLAPTGNWWIRRPLDRRGSGDFLFEFAGGDQRDQLRGGQRPAEQIPLCVLTAIGIEE